MNMDAKDISPQNCFKEHFPGNLHTANTLTWLFHGFFTTPRSMKFVSLKPSSKIVTVCYGKTPSQHMFEHIHGFCDLQIDPFSSPDNLPAVTSPIIGTKTTTPFSTQKNIREFHGTFCLDMAMDQYL